MLAEHLLGVFQRRAGRCGYESLGSHHFPNRTIQVRLEDEVPIRNDAHQDIVGVHDGDPADRKLPHEPGRASQGCPRTQGDGLEDHAALGTLHSIHLRALSLGGHVLVDDPDPAFPGHGDRHLILRHRVHGGRDERYREANVAGESRRHIDILGMDSGSSWCEKDVVERQRFAQRKLDHTAVAYG